MKGAILGDIIGSRFEFSGNETKDFELFTEQNFFTDDTVMTCAIAKALLDCDGDYYNLGEQAIVCMQDLGTKYEGRGYGESFYNWLHETYPKPYNSYGNGSAMRISPVAYVARSLEEVKSLSRKVTEVSHNHIEGIKGAEATAVAIWLALNKHSKEEIKNYIEKNYYNLDFNQEDLYYDYSFDVTCQGSVPQSIYAFLVSNSYEDAVRTAISYGGDADTMGCIAGSIAEAYYGIPKEIEKRLKDYLDTKLFDIVKKWCDYIKR